MSSQAYKINIVGLDKSNKLEILSTYDRSRLIKPIIAKYFEFEEDSNFKEVATETLNSVMVVIHNEDIDQYADGILIVCDPLDGYEYTISIIKRLIDMEANSHMKIGVIVSQTGQCSSQAVARTSELIQKQLVSGINYPLGIRYRNQIKMMILTSLVKGYHITFINEMVRDIYMVKMNPLVREIEQLTVHNTILSQSLRALQREKALMTSSITQLKRDKSSLELMCSKNALLQEDNDYSYFRYGDDIQKGKVEKKACSIM